MKKREKSLTELIIDLDRVNRDLERLKDPAYIEAEARRVFGDRKYTPENTAAAIANILNIYG